jgi:hypothetical protein
MEGAVDSQDGADAVAITVTATAAAPTLRGRDRELAAIGDCLGRLGTGLDR